MKKLRHREVGGLPRVTERVRAQPLTARPQPPPSDGGAGRVLGANCAHAKNKGAFAWSCGGPSHGRSDQEAVHCEETAVLGAKPAGEAALSSKGHCLPPTLGLGAAGLSLALPKD